MFLNGIAVLIIEFITLAGCLLHPGNNPLQAIHLATLSEHLTLVEKALPGDRVTFAGNRDVIAMPLHAYRCLTVFGRVASTVRQVKEVLYRNIHFRLRFRDPLPCQGGYRLSLQ